MHLPYFSYRVLRKEENISIKINTSWPKSRRYFLLLTSLLPNWGFGMKSCLVNTAPPRVSPVRTQRRHRGFERLPHVRLCSLGLQFNGCNFNYFPPLVSTLLLYILTSEDRLGR